MTIWFYEQTDPYGEFSNFSPHGIQMAGVWWPTVEHCFQAQKFVVPNYRARIAKASTPKMAKSMGSRGLSNCGRTGMSGVMWLCSAH